MRPLALTMGEPAGIGGELALAAWKAAPCCFFAIDDPARLVALSERLGMAVPVVAIAEPAEAEAVFPRALPVLVQELAAEVGPGRLDPANAAAVIASIKRAVALVQAGEAAAVVTNPIHKETLYQAGFPYPGHTEYLAAQAGIDTAPVMMLACPDLRVVPVTIHLPLAEVAGALTTEAIVHAGRVTAAALTTDFRIATPRLAVAGLNPHAGEGGALGREEAEIIVPAVEALGAALGADGVTVAEPAPADSLFHAAARARYDAVLCMYHDQALIPLKTIDFARGVNITLGLPFVRTSPDHGTALDIAGQGRADPRSLLAAIETARDMAQARAAARAHAVA
ncbi:MAG: 4-hydroxythreonine-4-phosphate dehydrogenase PdxA [Alphaproteobacteria bacterium]